MPGQCHMAVPHASRGALVGCTWVCKLGTAQPHTAHLLDGLVQQAQLVGAGWRVAQRLLCDQAVHSGQEAVHALHTLGGPHLHCLCGERKEGTFEAGAGDPAAAQGPLHCAPAALLNTCDSTSARGGHWVQTQQPTQAQLAAPTLVSRRGPMNISYSRRLSAPYCHTYRQAGRWAACREIGGGDTGLAVPGRDWQAHAPIHTPQAPEHDSSQAAESGSAAQQAGARTHHIIWVDHVAARLAHLVRPAGDLRATQSRKAGRAACGGWGTAEVGSQGRSAAGVGGPCGQRMAGEAHELIAVLPQPGAGRRVGGRQAGRQAGPPPPPVPVTLTLGSDLST